MGTGGRSGGSGGRGKTPRAAADRARSAGGTAAATETDLGREETHVK